MIEIEMVTASEREQGYGIRFVSAVLYRVTGRGVHNPHSVHRVQVWDNRGRENAQPDQWNPFSGKPGPGRWLDPSGKGADSDRTILMSAESTMITDPPTRVEFADEIVHVGDVVRLMIDGEPLDCRVDVRVLRDPELTPIDETGE